MTGLPIAEVVHSRNMASAHLQTIAMSGHGQGTSVTAGLPSEPLIAAVNLSSKYQNQFRGNISSEITATKINPGLNTMSLSPTSIDTQPDFQLSSPISHKVSGTTVNPLLMSLPAQDSNPINVAFPPTQHLLQASSSIPTQTVETAGLMQAGSPLSGITSLNPDSLTIRITNVPTETTNQGIYIF